jgi:hypothetical protein
MASLATLKFRISRPGSTSAQSCVSRSQHSSIRSNGLFDSALAPIEKLVYQVKRVLKGVYFASQVWRDPVYFEFVLDSCQTQSFW